jgi:hypothetical protein
LLSGEKYMKRLALSLLAVAAVATMASPAQAQNWLNLPSFQHWNIDSMVTNEQARINSGRANGSLTAEEANRLQNRLNDINALKFQISRDGVSQADRQLIDSQLDQLSQQIYRESNDRQMLGSKPWGWSNTYKPNNNDWRYGHWNNGKWETKNNWNQYNNWRAKNWHNEWNRNNNNNNNNWNGRRGDGQPGAGITAQEQARINRERMKLQQKQAQAGADGRLDYHERKQLEQRQNRINQQERRDRRD